MNEHTPAPPLRFRLPATFSLLGATVLSAVGRHHSTLHPDHPVRGRSSGCAQVTFAPSFAVLYSDKNPNLETRWSSSQPDFQSQELAQPPALPPVAFATSTIAARAPAPFGSCRRPDQRLCLPAGLRPGDRSVHPPRSSRQRVVPAIKDESFPFDYSVPVQGETTLGFWSTFPVWTVATSGLPLAAHC